MFWVDKLNEMRKSLNWNLDELSRRSGVPIGTLSKISAGITKDPKLDTMAAIVHCMGYTLDDLDENNVDITDNERKHLKKYRLLTPAGKKAIDNTIDTMIEYENSFTQATATRIQDNVINIAARQMPLYATPASAGLGQYIDNSDYELVDVGPECPQQTNFLLRVQGDSMEPKLHDGDLLYIKQQPSVEDSEIGVFYLDGNVYVKKQEHKNNICYLISLNLAYAPIEVKEQCDCICYGKVLN